MLHCHDKFVKKKKNMYYEFYLTYFRRNADRMPHEWNINRNVI